MLFPFLYVVECFNNQFSVLFAYFRKYIFTSVMIDFFKSYSSNCFYNSQTLLGSMSGASASVFSSSPDDGTYAGILLT